MVYIIIPVYNRKNLTKECLLSLQKQSFKEFKIVVIDDGSIDNTSEMVEKLFPEIILLKGNGMLWWTGSVNLGLKYIFTCKSVEYVLTLNNDLVVYNNYLESLIICAKQNPESLIGSVCVDIFKSNRVFYAGTHLSWKPYRSRLKYFSNKVDKLPPIIESDTLTGRGTLIPLKLFNDIGLFDQKRFPHYGADEDFSLRAKKNGYKLIICKNAIVKSHIKETGSSASRYDNIIRYYKDLFSIKSSNNIIRSNNFVIRHSPQYYVPINLFINSFIKLTLPIRNIIIGKKSNFLSK